MPKARPDGSVVLSADEYARVLQAISDGLSYDGGHHKQFYLAETARALGLDLSTWDDDDLGMPA